MNSSISGTGLTPEDEFEMYRYIFSPQDLTAIEPTKKKTFYSAGCSETAFLTILQKKERCHKLLKNGQEEDFTVALCENHPVRVGCSVHVHDGWFEITPENYVWEHKMGPIIEIINTNGRPIYIKIDADDFNPVEVPIREREGPWFCANWYHKVYYKKGIPPGYTYLQKQNMKWYLPLTSKKRRKIFITVIKVDDDGGTSKRISRKELIVATADLQRKNGFAIAVDAYGQVIPQCLGL